MFLIYVNEIDDVGTANSLTQYFVIDKANRPTSFDVLETTWDALAQRFKNILSSHNFPEPRIS
jgi:hypothetical protein